MAPLAGGDGGQDDPLIEVRRGLGDGERGDETHEPTGAAELSRARRAVADVPRQQRRVGLAELVDEVRVDQAARGVAIHDRATRRAVHILYMTGLAWKVAGSVTEFGRAVVDAPKGWPTCWRRRSSALSVARDAPAPRRSRRLPRVL